MNNLIVFPMVLPILVGILFLFFPSSFQLHRWATFITLVINAIISLIILHQIQVKGILRIDFGEWVPPFGILFVADSFATILVVTTNIVSAIVVLYAMRTIGEKREKFYFYSFVLFLVAGVNGSFLTGDLFNLFVTFEVMLLASYVLITLGGTKIQWQESFKYIAINIVSSSLFLIAIGYLYGVLGTLNMAHLSVRIAESGQTPLLTVISLLFLIVLSIKAGLLLFQWLPGAYSTPPTAIAALFGALMTKVGIYALFRVFTLLFYHEQQISHNIIGFMAIITIIAGSIGAIAFKNIRQIISYNVVISVGFILIALATMSTSGFEGATYYLIHDMIGKAVLILLGGTMIYLTKTELLDEMSGLIRNYPILGWLFFITSLSLTGIPPLSGFIGKLLIGQGTIETEAYLLLGVGFFSSIVVLYSLIRIFMNCFWGETIMSEEEERPLRQGVLLPSILLVALMVFIGIGAESIALYIKDAAHTLSNPSVYIDAVLND